MVQIRLGGDAEGLDEALQLDPGAGRVALEEVPADFATGLEGLHAIVRLEASVGHEPCDGSGEGIDLRDEVMVRATGGAALHVFDVPAIVADGGRGAAPAIAAVRAAFDGVGRGGQISLLRRDWVARQSQSQNAKVTVEWGQCASKMRKRQGYEEIERIKDR